MSPVALDTKIEAMAERFSQMAEPLGVLVRRCADVDTAAAWVVEIARELDAPAVFVSSELAAVSPALVSGVGRRGLKTVEVTDVVDARDKPLGLALAAAGIAETGSALMAETTLADRAVAMTTLAVVIVLPAEHLLPILDSALPLLREVAQRPGGGNATFITGPSRTADIEMSLTVGVQGPATVAIAIVDDLGGSVTA